MAFQIFDLPGDIFGIGVNRIVWTVFDIGVAVDDILSSEPDTVFAHLEINSETSRIIVRTRRSTEFSTAAPGPDLSDAVELSGEFILQIDNILLRVENIGARDPDEPYSLEINPVIAQEIVDYFNNNNPAIRRFIIWDGAGESPSLLLAENLFPQLVLEYSETLGLYRERGIEIFQDSALNQDSPEEIIAVLLSANLPTGIIRVWTGTPNLIFEGNEYMASRILDVSSIGNVSDLNSNSRSIQVTISSIDPQNRNIFLNPVGLAEVRLQTLTSMDSGITWRKIGQQVVGVISSPVLSGGAYTFQIEPRSALVDRARLVYWSHEDRIRRYGIKDQGMSQMPKLSDQGVLGRWPNP